MCITMKYGEYEMAGLKHLENGNVLIAGKEHILPKELTSIRGIPEDMLMVKLKGFTYADAFREGCRVLGGRVESDIDVMEKELNVTEREYAAITMKRDDLRARISELNEVHSTVVNESREKNERICAEFERLLMEAGVFKKNNVLTHLSTMSGLSFVQIDAIYKAATPEGSATPDKMLVRIELNKVI